MSIELVWTLMALAGLVVAVVSFFDAWAGVRRMSGRAEALQIIARGYRRGEAITIVIQAVLLGMGISPLLNPTPVVLSPFVAALIAINGLLLVNSLLHARDRLNVRALIAPPWGDE